MDDPVNPDFLGNLFPEAAKDYPFAGDFVFAYGSNAVRDQFQQRDNFADLKVLQPKTSILSGSSVTRLENDRENEVKPPLLFRKIWVRRGTPATPPSEECWGMMDYREYIFGANRWLLS
ncbi:hypothetical protein BS17DRAFT_770824, partial [Gyrodon lividus]